MFVAIAIHKTELISTLLYTVYQSIDQSINKKIIYGDSALDVVHIGDARE